MLAEMVVWRRRFGAVEKWRESLSVVLESL